MNSDVVVSVIMPAYNSEKYIEKSIKSILSQSFKKIELLIVNDGSTDKTESICRALEKEDSRIRIISKENGGVSSARNIALKKAIGKYVCLIDSDDLIDDRYIESLYSIASKEKLDLAVCSFLEFSKEQEILHEKDYIIRSNILIGNEKYDFLFDRKFSGYACGKLYRTELIKKNKISFRENIHMLEDEIFTLDYLEACSKVATIEDRKYFYRINEKSISRSGNNERWFSVLEAVDIILDNIKTMNSLRKREYSYKCLYFLFEAKYRAMKNKQKTNHIDSKINCILDNCKKFTIKQKIKIYLYRHFNRIVFDIRGIL